MALITWEFKATLNYCIFREHKGSSCFASVREISSERLEEQSQLEHKKPKACSSRGLDEKGDEWGVATQHFCFIPWAGMSSCKEKAGWSVCGMRLINLCHPGAGEIQALASLYTFWRIKVKNGVRTKVGFQKDKLSHFKVALQNTLTMSGGCQFSSWTRGKLN